MASPYEPATRNEVPPLVPMARFSLQMGYFFEGVGNVGEVKGFVEFASITDLQLKISSAMIELRNRTKIAMPVHFNYSRTDRKAPNAIAIEFKPSQSMTKSRLILVVTDYTQDLDDMTMKAINEFGMEAVCPPRYSAD